MPGGVVGGGGSYVDTCTYDRNATLDSLTGPSWQPLGGSRPPSDRPESYPLPLPVAAL